jgi:hypothetical protein
MDRKQEEIDNFGGLLRIRVCVRSIQRDKREKKPEEGAWFVVRIASPF